MKYDWNDIWDTLNECPQKYGKIDDDDDFAYNFDEEEISEAKWKLLTPEQQDALYDWCKEQGDDKEEEWYMKNAPEIWERIEHEAGEEEVEAYRLIDEARRMLEYVESDDDFYRKEYYWDKI